jgi:colanic acid/amylovoran biosynthesis glycosyltransferase
MKICVVLGGVPGPSETFLRHHVEALRTDVVSPVWHPEATSDWRFTPRVWSLRTGRGRHDGLGDRAIRRLREHTIGLPEPRWPAGMAALWRRYLETERPDVVLAEYGPNGLLAAAGCRSAGIPLVVHFHGFDATAMLRIRRYRRALPALFAVAGGVVVVGRHMRQTLARLGCPEEKLHLVPCGANLAKIRPSTEVGSRPCRFLGVGRINANKGPLLTLEAFAYCLHEVGWATLDLVGAGEQLPAARRWIARRGLQDRVRLLGARPPDYVFDRLAASSVFVQHSMQTRTGWIEGWGVSIAEAAGAGLPVVATRLGGIPDQVVDGVTGLLVEPGDWRAMGRAMARLAGEPALRQRLGAAGRRNVARVGDAGKQVAELEALLESVVSAVASSSAPRRRAEPGAGRWLSETGEPGLVSVIVPTHQRGHVITEALDSVRAQTHRPIELLVVDDGSTDETGKVVERWVADRAEPALRVRYVWQENAGAQAARNRGLRESRGAYIQFLDSDDLLEPEKLEKQVARLRRTGADLCYGKTRCTRADGTTVRIFAELPEVAGRPWIARNAWHTSSPLFTRRVCARVGPWATDLKGCQEYEYAARVKALGYRAEYLDEFVDQRRDRASESIRGQARYGLAVERAALRIVNLLEDLDLEVPDLEYNRIAKNLAAAASRNAKEGLTEDARRALTHARRTARFPMNLGYGIAAEVAGLLPAIAVRSCARAIGWRRILERRLEVPAWFHRFGRRKAGAA